MTASLFFFFFLIKLLSTEATTAVLISVPSDSCSVLQEQLWDASVVSCLLPVLRTVTHNSSDTVYFRYYAYLLILYRVNTIILYT